VRAFDPIARKSREKRQPARVEHSILHLCIMRMKRVRLGLRTSAFRLQTRGVRVRARVRACVLYAYRHGKRQTMNLAVSVSHSISDHSSLSVL
jgi:hypothetical protein